ncbi:MAG TPA: flagellin [Terriglobales bacterium]|nr:flagellin [Terriglobales bacterium]
MPVSILNNIASLAAENQLNITNSSLQSTLFQLSSGSRINSGADDAAGLAIADGLQANITALTQSARNANDGVGKLQVADGALAQVTTLLNRAVTLATEAATGTVSDTQRTALDAEFTAIKAEIDRIGNNTTYNGTQVFASGTTTDANTVVGSTGTLTLATALTTGKTFTIDAGSKTFTFTAGATDTVGTLINAINSDTTVGAKAFLDANGALNVVDPAGRNNIRIDSSAATASTIFGTFANLTTSPSDPNVLQGATAALTQVTALTSGQKLTITSGTKSFTYTAGATAKVQDLLNAINSDTTVGAKAFLDSTGKLNIVDPQNRNNLAIDPASTLTTAGAFSNTTGNAPSTTSIYLSDSSGSGASTIAVSIGALSSSGIAYGASSVSLANDDLISASDAQTSLTDINQAIQNIAGIRGGLGAGINRLQSASNVISSQVQNLTSAEDGIRAADIPSAVANLTKFSILEQTGIAALAQANQQQQLVLSLLK